MRKLTMLATMLAMVLATAVPAFAQTFVDNSDTTTTIDTSIEDSNIAVNDADQVGGDQSNITGDGNVNINEQEQTSEAVAGDVLYESDLFFGYPWYYFLV